MKIDIKLDNPNFADGLYNIEAKGCIMASLYWANEQGILSDWTCFAYIPISPNGFASFNYIGKRAIPSEATYVLARAVSFDFLQIYEFKTKIFNNEYNKEFKNIEYMKHFVIMSDIHISKKPYRLIKALRNIKEKQPDGILLIGDIVNDGTIEQFKLIHKCLENEILNIPICATSGNHDYPIYPIPYILDGICDYKTFQNWTINHNRNLKYFCEENGNGGCAVQIGDIDIITINAISHWRKFKFENYEQLKWLEEHINTNKSSWHIILCHAPLYKYNPQRKFGNKNRDPYLSKDKYIQKIIDTHNNIIFISGYTHVSPNITEGCVNCDLERKNFYINSGSLCPNEIKDSEILNSIEWSRGNIVELFIDKNKIIIIYSLLNEGKKISRGYYVFKINN